MGQTPRTGQEVAGPEPRSANAPILRLLLAFLLSLPLLALSMLASPARPETAAAWAGGSWAVCGALAGWNALEYALGRAAHGAATPVWLRWVLAAPYFLVSWICVRTLAAMVAGLAYLASAA
jgi:hypothetical protein